MKKYILFFGLILFFNSFLLAQERESRSSLKANSVLQPTAMTDSLVKNFIKVYMEQDQGTFNIKTKENDNLLYHKQPNNAYTSHANFCVEDRSGKQIFSMRPNVSGATPVTKNSIWNDGEKLNIVFNKCKDIEIKQELIPRENIEKEAGAVLIKYILTNTSTTETKKVGVALKLDTYLGYFEEIEFAPNVFVPIAEGNDEARVALPSYFIEEKTIVNPIPDYWLAFEDEQDPKALVAIGTLRGRDLVCPDFLYVGDFDNIHTGILFDEHQLPEGGKYNDSEIFMRWDMRELAPGESTYVSTLYGMAGTEDCVGEDLWITSKLPFDTLTIDADGDYEPNPFDYIVTVHSLGSTIDNLQATISFSNPSIFQLEGINPFPIGTLEFGTGKVANWRIRVRADACINELNAKQTISVIVTNGSITEICPTEFYITPKTYSLNLFAEPSNAGTATKSPNRDKYGCNESVTITAVPYDGFKFLRWEGDVSGDPTENPKSVYFSTNDKDKNITAIFEPDNFNLTIDVEPTTDVATTTPPVGIHTYKNGDNVELSYQNAESCYKFLGWRDNGSGNIISTDVTTTITMQSDRNITALFEQKRFTINDRVEGIGEIKMDPISDGNTYNCGQTVRLEAIETDNCYEFVGWTGDITSNNSTIDIIYMEKDIINITANFKMRVFTITEETFGIGRIEMNPDSYNGEYNCGTSIRLTARPDACYDFDRWEFIGNGLPSSTDQNPITFPISSDVQVKAHFVIQKFKLTTSVNIDTAATIDIDPKKDEYDCGDIVTLTVRPDFCYNFLYWEDDITNTNPVRIITMDQGSIDYKAILAIKRFTITSSTDFQNSGTTTPIIDTCDCGDIVPLKVEPECPYSFVKWNDNNVSETRNIIMDGNKSFIANMARISFEITRAEPNIFPNIVVDLKIDSTWFNNTGIYTVTAINRSQFTVIDEDTVGNSTEIKNFNLVGSQIIYSLYGNCYDKVSDLRRRAIVKFVYNGCEYTATATYTINLNAGCDSCSRLVKKKTTPDALFQNRPNPYNPETIIRYSISDDDHVFIAVYDLLGREVATLVNEQKEAGEYEVIFKPKGSLPSGVYFYRIKTNRFQDVKKMTFLK